MSTPSAQRFVTQVVSQIDMKAPGGVSRPELIEADIFS